MLKPGQIRAARAILNWSQEQLARASGLSLATIRKIELGYISPRHKTTDAIHSALYAAGIEFIEPDGARRRPCDIQVYEGRLGAKDFLDDLQQTAIQSGGLVLIIAPTAESFAKFCGLPSILRLDRLIDMNNTVEIRCLLTDEVNPPLSTPRFQFRSISKNYVDPVPFCTYGDKYAIAVPNGEPFSKMIVIETNRMAKSARQHFLSLWEKATPMIPGDLAEASKTGRKQVSA